MDETIRSAAYRDPERPIEARVADLLGRMTLDAVLERNYPVVQSAVLVIGAMFMLVNLVTDLLYGAIDPRVRRR